MSVPRHGPAGPRHGGRGLGGELDLPAAMLEALVFDYVGFPEALLAEVADAIEIPVFDLGAVALDAVAEHPRAALTSPLPTAIIRVVPIMTDSQTYELTVHGDVVRPDGQVLSGGWIGVSGGRIECISPSPLTGK